MNDPRVTPAVDRLVLELEGIFRERLSMVAVYGDGIHLGEAAASHGDRAVHTLAVVASLTADDMRACAGLAEHWAARGLAVPLLLTAVDLRRSLDAFPMEFSDIIAQHHTVRGTDLLEGLAVAREDVRRACEVQARSHALHLRESYVECGANPRRLARLVVASAPPFRALLQSIASLAGHANPTDDAALIDMGSAAGLDAVVLRKVVEIAQSGAVGAGDAEAFYLAYAEAAERLVQHVDAWRV